MKFLLCLVVVAVSVSAMPADLVQLDQCGAKEVKKTYNYVVTGEAYDLECELCLDMVLIGETYAECDEAIVEHKMEERCDEKYSSNRAEDKACRSMVDKVGHEAIEDTEQDPTKVCKKLIHKTCTYGKI